MCAPPIKFKAKANQPHACMSQSHLLHAARRLKFKVLDKYHYWTSNTTLNDRYHLSGKVGGKMNTFKDLSAKIHL